MDDTGGTTMAHTIPRIQPIHRTPLARIGAALATALVLHAAGAQAGGHGMGGQRTFATPEQAGEALAAAWHSGRTADLARLFGPRGQRLLHSDDPAATQHARSTLAAAYDAHHAIEPVGDDQALLILGQDNFPFPIPLAKAGKGWRFDTRAGEEEILSRRIGRNELNAIQVCRAYVEAQREYALRHTDADGRRRYAERLGSSDGRQDGLYWPQRQEGQNEPESPLGPMVAAAASGEQPPGGIAPAPYHGYYYRILTRQGAHAPGGAADYVENGRLSGGFALVAFPARYGETGVMTFIVNQNGIVFEKNLGPRTDVLAREMSRYDPDPSWRIPKRQLPRTTAATAPAAPVVPAAATAPGR